MIRNRNRAAAGRRLLLLTGALLATGCASGNRPVVSRQPGSLGSEVQLTVENQNFKDAVIYAVWSGGPRDRLGMVTGNTTQTFEFPWRTGDLQVEVDFIAGDDIATDGMSVTQGDHLHVQIPPGA